ncbi:MAG: GAF domain-containing protein [Holophagales bacterium]|nr:GAF domain-containing protein [Holophagales bacterium]MBK9969152.1 GAF domain-containing protein [Holophagales bacterium]
MGSARVAVVLLADAGGRVRDVSGDGLESAFGWPGALVGSQLGTLGSPGRPLFPADRLDAARRDGEVRYDVPAAAPGERPPLSVHLRVFDVAGTALLRASVSRLGENGDREAAEELAREEARVALERSRTELEAIYEHAPVMMCVVDGERRVLFANQAFTSFTGVDEASLRGGRACGVFGCINAKEDPLGCGFGPKCPACDLRLAIADTFATGTPHHAVEYRARLERGGERREVVLLCATALLDRTESPRLLLCMQDVTERVRVTEALAEAVQREVAMDRAISSLYRPVVSPETDVPAIARAVFEQALRLTGSPFAFVAEVDPETGAVSPHVLSKILEDGPGTRAAGDPVTFPRGADGRYASLWGHPLNMRKGCFTNDPVRHPAARGLPSGHVPIDRFLAVPVLAGDQLVGEIAVANAPADYTDRDLKTVERLAEFYALGIQRKRVEAQVRSLADSLETRVRERTAELLAANRELEAFSYSVSHDLRAPLRAIVGFTQAVLEDLGPSLPPASAEDLGRAVAAANRMSHLIDGLLGLSRLTRRDMQRGPLDLSALAREVVDEQRALHPDRNVDVTVEDGLAVLGDKELLRLVLHNLLENAWKFTARTPGARVDVGSTTSESVPPGDEAGRRAFFVRDNGAGFEMAYADKLFRPFHRLHAESDYPGSGIGLASAQRIVRRHGGTIWASSAPGAGTAFYFTLEERG